MVLKIHSNAIESCNKKAEEILELVQVFPQSPAREKNFPSELHNIIISGEDIIGEVSMEGSIVDKYGKTIQRFFHKDNKKFGFQEDDYQLIIQIIETLQKQKNIRNKLSYEFIEEVFFEWLKEELGNEEILETFIEYLDNRAKQSIKPMTLWVPIAFLEIETPFTVANVEICTLSKEMIKIWMNDTVTLQDKENKDRSLKFFDNIKENYQGLACAVMTIDAEPEYAFQYAIEEAQRITAILGIFSRGTWVPNVKCVSNIKGSENTASATVFSRYGEDNNFQINTREIEKQPSIYWKLTQEDIINIKKWALDDISLLLTTDKPNKFEESILTLLFLYSKAAFTDDPIEKIVYMLTSLESILLKNSTEPIQQNLSERMALFISKELEERKKIIKIIKSIYGIRSRYLHHGNSSSELKDITKFMEYVWHFFVALIGNANKFSTKEDFISAIEDRKLS
ncbi:MAG: hypothetical protein KAI79_19285 [Bacteroidales bacterium]|nr:hypothetical protein [Bacteroidales bacterium]